MNKPSYIAIEIGGTKLQIVSGDGAGKILQRHRFSVEPRRGADGIRARIESALPDILSETRPVAVGVGFGGPADWQTGKIARSHQIEGWSEFPLAQWLRKLTGIPVFVENDANAAALGEALHGAGRNFNPVFYVTLGSGVGGGLVIDGKIYHGAKPGESEIGHLRLDRDGTLVESRCSGWAVDRKVRNAIAGQPDSVLAKLAGAEPGGEAKLLKPALDQGDSAAEKIVRETADDLAFALSHVTHLFHPAILVLGGGLSLIGEPLRSSVAATFPGYLMEVFRPGPVVALAQLGEDAVPIGALALAAHEHKSATETSVKSAASQSGL